jgi:hypothetical protein
VETQVRTPQMVFMQPQRLVVPLFQRPYVWNEERQWEPLWEDLIRLTDRLIAHPDRKHQPHFLGAVVLQQVPNAIGLMQQRTIIDGQQRLTTLQLLLDALRVELVAVDARQSALRIETLVANPEPYWKSAEDRFKVWPTNRDRPGFNNVMQGRHEAGESSGKRIPEAHLYFREKARHWLESQEPSALPTAAAAIETVARELLQMVVIDLGVDENAQEIFETLNARGTPLTAADLVKNFIFQRLLDSEADVEKAYQENWREFETGFWETEVSVGRIRYQRSSIFLNHWLVAQTGEEIVAREVFERFKRFADFDANLPMTQLLEKVHAAAGVYHSFVASADRTGQTDPLSLFAYRTSVLESEVIKPLVLYLLDPSQPAIPEHQLNKVFDVVESWMVRRMLVRATTKNYSQVISEIISNLRKSDRAVAGDVVEQFLAQQSSGRSYWPDDSDLRDSLQTLIAYRRLGRGRLRMVLEAVEDFLRGFKEGQSGMGGERVARGVYAIEHVLPRKWTTHWPYEGDPAARDRIIHTIGNLTLLTSRLNTKVSNAAWLGAGGKREGLEGHDVLVLNRDLVKKDLWNEEAIERRTRELVEVIIRIWPVPPNHRSNFIPDRAVARKKVLLADLLNAGELTPGMSLYPRRKKLVHKVATLLSDGQIELDGKVFGSPSLAASSVTGKSANGWWFFLVDPNSRRSLRNVRSDYVKEMAVDIDDDEDDDEDDEG